MGVKYLWSVIEPACKEKPVGELFGKRLAIDTSCWVVSDNQILPSHIAKPHLRNLFFRTASLLENGIDPIYVLEGKAPELKAQVMKKRREVQRQQQQIKSGSSRTGTCGSTDNSTGRSRYKYIQQECTELLTALGVVTIASVGEAEAACAGLNHQGAVDGCITVDGDAFLYGAKTVYRNLSTDINNFVCQEYSMDIIETRLNLTRDKLIAMAILFGCDYLPDGVPGVGKESALRVISTWKKGQALEILKFWHSEKMIENIPLRPPHCSQCKHPGSLRFHAKSGCELCKTSNGGCEPSKKNCHCNWHINEIRYEELAIHEKVNRLKEMDLEKIFDEFKNDVHTQKNGNAIPNWQMPCIQTFVKIATNKLKWEPQYAAEKILPLLSRWIIIHGNTQPQNQLPVTPLGILKKRVKRGCPMYEVEWKFNKDTENFPNLFNTLEPQFLIEKDFHHLVPQPIPKPIKKKKRKNVCKNVKSPNHTGKLDVVDMFKKMTLDPKLKLNSSALLPADSSFFDLSGGTDDSDMSDIINNICDRKKASKTDKHRVPNSIEDVCHDQNLFLSSPSKLVSRNLSDNDLGKRFQLLERHERPLPNFSFNFSIEKFLETSSNHCLHQDVDDNAKILFSTPQKRSSDSKEIAEQDSFSTPSPLAERFRRFHL